MIAAPGVLRRLPGGFMMERGLSPEEVRFYLLYWDRVVIPANNLVYVGVPDEADLVACGAIERPRVQYSGSFEGDQVTNAVLACQGHVAKDLSKVDDVDWVIHQFAGDVLALPGTAVETAALRMSIASILPVPPAETPIADVLEFRERRSGDLASLHDCLDGIYLDILRAPDVELGKRKLIAELRSQVQSLETDSGVTSLWRGFDLSVEFTIRGRDVVLGLGGGALFGAATGVPAPLTAVVGAIASLIEIKLSKSFEFGAASQSQRLAYLSEARAERVLG